MTAHAQVNPELAPTGAAVQHGSGGEHGDRVLNPQAERASVARTATAMPSSWPAWVATLYPALTVPLPRLRHWPKPFAMAERIDFSAGRDGCWAWASRVDEHGYGMVWFNGDDERCHRAAWALVNGPIPDGLCVCHRCDNPPCCNPAHLFLGTHDDNMADRARKGRSAAHSGATNGRARLSEADVRAIRASTTTHAALARRFGVTATTIRDIRIGKLWRSVAGGVP